MTYGSQAEPHLSLMTAEDSAKAMGQHLRLARVGKQWSVADLADRAGVSACAVTAVEAGDGRLQDYVAASMVLGFGHELWNASRPRPTSLDELERIELARCERTKG